VDPVLLDSSFLIDLEREIETGVAGPAMAWLRKNRKGEQRALIVSCISAAEFLEGCADAQEGMKFITRYLVSARKLPVLKVAGDFGIFPRALLSSRRGFAVR